MSLPSPSKIVCVGRNYALHARELGSRIPSEPLIFLKPPSSVIGNGDPIVVPQWAGRIDFEGEIGVVISQQAKRIRASDAWDVVAGVAPVNDVTARDLQRSDDQWSRAKGFDTFFPLAECVPLSDVDLATLTLKTRVNGEVRQCAAMDDMIFSPPAIIEYVTRFMTLEPGDVLAMGTPEGVGPLVAGDVVEVEVSGAGSIVNPVVRERLHSR